MNLTNPKVISSLLKEHGFHFSKALGQNFLTDAEVPQKMAELCGADKETDVLEIGPGIGALTSELLSRAGHVTAVELDRRLIPILNRLFGEAQNFSLVEGDILKLDAASLFPEPGNLKRGVCANLPYYITTPAITRLLEQSAGLSFICVMVQKEVARRFAAKAGTKDFGAITLFCNYHAECEILFDVPKESFVPSPKVDSSVVLFKILKIPPVGPKNLENMFKLIRAAFAQRRKTFKNAAQSAFPGLRAEILQNALFSLGKSEKVRGEELNLAEFALLSDALQDEIS